MIHTTREILQDEGGGEVGGEEGGREGEEGGREKTDGGVCGIPERQLGKWF